MTKNKKYFYILATVLYAISIIFLILFILQKNWEFVWYITNIFFIWTPLFLIFNKNNKHKLGAVIGLIILIFLHQLGGYLILNGTRLYDTILLPIYSGPYEELVILKYDQIVHFIGGGIIAFILYYSLESERKRGMISDTNPFFLPVLVILSSLGVSLIHEMLEFVSYFLGDQGVGLYFNNMLDVYFAFFGIILMILFLKIKDFAKK